MNEEILVIGHRKPDTDSIAAAMGYAALKNRTDGGSFLPARCDRINDETEFVLSYFDSSAPILITDVRTRAKDILEKNTLSVGPDTTLRQAGIFMRQHELKTLAVVDENLKVLGLLTVGDLARLLLESWDTGGMPMDEPVKNIMQQKNLVIFNENDLLLEIRRTMLETRYRNYPVVDDTQRLVGFIGRYHLLAARGKKVILVDHNERSQAAPGIEEAETIEIIDHHRLGDIETADPIMVHIAPLGSTSTIVAQMYKNNDLEPEPTIAGLLCAAILSDTMLFKSPTVTSIDKEMAAWTGEIAGIDVMDFGRQMFRAGAFLSAKDASDIVLEDFKEFHFGKKIVGIGQIEVMGKDTLPFKRETLRQELMNIQATKNYDLVILMVTDLLRNGTELLYAGPESRAVELAFNCAPQAEKTFLPGVMSRKKQVVPHLRRVLQQQ